MHILQRSILNLRTFCYTLFAIQGRSPYQEIMVYKYVLAKCAPYQHIKPNIGLTNKRRQKSKSHVSLNKHNSIPLIVPYRILAIKTCVQLKMTKPFVQREKLKMQDHILSNVFK
jgi:hypothetical protein